MSLNKNTQKIAICLWGDDCISGFNDYRKYVLGSISNLYSIDLFISTYEVDDIDNLMEKYKPTALHVINNKIDNDKTALLRSVLDLASTNLRANSTKYKFITLIRSGIKWTIPFSKLNPALGKFNISCNLSDSLNNKLWIFDQKNLELFIRLLDNNLYIAPCDFQNYIESVFKEINYMTNVIQEIPVLTGMKEDATTGRVVIALWGKIPDKGISSALCQQINIYKRIKKTDRLLITSQNPWINSILLNFMPTSYSFMLPTDTDVECFKKILKSINARSIHDRIVLLRCTASPTSPVSEWELDSSVIKYMVENSMDSIIMAGSMISQLEESIELTGAFPV
jgi:hypothetical protein